MVLGGAVLWKICGVARFVKIAATLKSTELSAKTNAGERVPLVCRGTMECSNS